MYIYLQFLRVVLGHQVLLSCRDLPSVQLVLVGLGHHQYPGRSVGVDNSVTQIGINTFCSYIATDCTKLTYMYIQVRT